MFHTVLCDSEQRTIIHTDPEEVSKITSREVEAALRDMNNGTAASNDHINIDTIKAEENTISKTLAKLYNKCLSERRTPKSWKNAKTVIIFKNGNKKDHNNYRPICLITYIYKILTKRLEKTLEENKPRKQGRYRSRYSTTDHIQVVIQLKEKCSEYNIPV